MNYRGLTVIESEEEEDRAPLQNCKEKFNKLFKAKLYEKYPDHPYLTYNDYEKLDPKKFHDFESNSKNNYNFYLNNIIFIFQL
jgi:hypothetical protein